MNVVRRVARNITYLFAWQTASRLLGLVLNVVLARRLQDAGYGRYSLILVIITIAGMAADFGTANIVIREISRRRSESNSLLGAMLLLRGITTLLVAGAVFLTLVAAGVESDFALPLALATLSIIPTSLATAFEAALQGFERMDLSALGDVVFSLALTAAGVAVVSAGGGVTAMTGVYLGASAVRLAYSSVAYRRLTCAAGSWRFSRERLMFFARESFPVLYWQLISLAYYKVDILLLGALRTEAEVGWYAAAYKLFEVPVIFGWMAVQSLLPLTSRLYEASRDRLALLFEKATKYIWITGLAAALLTLALAGPVIRLLLPGQYDPSIDVLAVLGFALPFMIGCALFGNIFIAMGLQGRMARWSLLSLVINVGLNLVLIPAYGVMGAAVTTLVSEIFSFVFFYVFTAHFLRHVRFIEVLLAPAAIAALLAAAVLLLQGMLWAPLLALVAAILFPALLLLLKVISQEDLGYFRQLRAES